MFDIIISIKDCISGKNGGFTIQKKEVLESLDSTTTYLKNDVIPMVKELEKEVGMKTIDTVYLSKLTESYNKFSNGKKIKDNEYLKNLVEILENLVKEETAIVNLINSSFKATTTDHTATVKELGVFNFIKKVEYIGTYTIDICLLIADAANGSSNVHGLIKERILKDIGVYNLYLTEIHPTNFKNMIKKLNTNPDLATEKLEETGDSAKTIMDINNQTIGGIGSSSFVGNPFYHFRKLLADWDHENYELAKAKREQYNLLITNLRLKQQRTNDPKIEKEIEAYTKKIIKLEKEIDGYING